MTGFGIPVEARGFRAQGEKIGAIRRTYGCAIVEWFVGGGGVRPFW